MRFTDVLKASKPITTSTHKSYLVDILVLIAPYLLQAYIKRSRMFPNEAFRLYGLHELHIVHVLICLKKKQAAINKTIIEGIFFEKRGFFLTPIALPYVVCTWNKCCSYGHNVYNI